MTRRGRRAFLHTTAAVAVGALTGCAEPERVPREDVTVVVVPADGDMAGPLEGVSVQEYLAPDSLAVGHVTFTISLRDGYTPAVVSVRWNRRDGGMGAARDGTGRTLTRGTNEVDITVESDDGRLPSEYFLEINTDGGMYLYGVRVGADDDS